MHTVEEVPIPAGSLASAAFGRIDYADGYRVALAPRDRRGPDELARAFFATAPGWVRGLMALRDRLVGPLGLKTTPAREQGSLPSGPLQPGTNLGLFHLFARDADEILLGQDDRHLDFRLSLHVSDGVDRRWLTVSTVVHFKNGFGRAYFMPVRLFHRRIVPAMLANFVAAPL